MPLLLFVFALVIVYAFILPKGVRGVVIGGVGLCAAALILIPVFARARENLRWPEREAKFLDARFIKVQRQGNQVVLTPNHWGWSDAYHPRTAANRRLPFTLKVGSQIAYRSADSGCHFVVQSLTDEGVVFNDGRNLGPVLLPWK